MRKSILSRLIFLSFTLLCTQNLFAQFEEGKEEVYYARIKGDSLLPTANSFRTITCLASPGEKVAERKIKNIITFKINEEDPTYLPANFTAVVSFDIFTATNPNTPDHRQLTVFYDTTSGAKYRVRDYLVLPAGETMVKITVTGITPNNTTGFNPRLVLQLENEMRVLRYYDLATQPSLLTPAFNTPTNSIDALNVSWNWDASGGTHNNMNQLEWAWVALDMADYYKDNGQINYDRLFSSNSTRVDLDFVQNAYKIPLLYADSGNLYYRVRPALRKNNGSVITGPWSAPQNFVFDIGHQPNLNWQSSTSFAENGKFKTVIQYFDGSLRSRQTVTKDNASGNTVVAETIYDLQGRPNIQILPTPTIDSLHPNIIQYFPDFNRFVGMLQDEDPAKYFDLTPAELQCKGALPLNITKGNGKYYSANNPWLNTEPMAKFIPDATGTNTENKTGGFAYTETRFMDDATERVQSQGGVGLLHQIGSGHETKYYYGKPAQQELDALFGTEAGDFSHYSKNMVRDANGQMSISYTDMHGRTIATALAGDPTPGIDSIINPTDYPQAYGVLTNQLLTPLSNNINGNSIESISTILAPYNTAYNFTYKLDPSILSQFSCTNQQICFDCKYDLEISIRSEDCNGLNFVRRYNNLQIVPANQACGTSMGFTGPGVNNLKQIDFTEVLSAGSWVVRKTLTINDSLFQIRRDSALKVFLCKTEQSIYDSVYNILYSTSGCGLPPGNTSACDSCMNHLGTFENYRVAYLISMGSVPGDNTHDAEIHVQYSADSTSCANACGVLNIELTTLRSIRKQMLTDMMPYTGQYALPLDSIRGPNSPVTPQTDYARVEAKYNIFTDHYLTNGNTNNPKPKFYRLPITETAGSFYYTEDNQIDSTVHGHDLSNQVILDTMSPPVFTSLFQPSWANSLIKRHPEFTKLKYAEDNLASSYEWLDKVQGTDIYWGTDGAKNKHYDEPLGTVNADPFFNMAGNATDKATMNTRITVGNIPNGNPSIWQMANSVVLCATVDSAHKEYCISQMVKDKMDPAITVDSLKDKVWENFRSLYFSYRNELVLQYIDAHAPNPLPTVEKDSLIRQGKTMNFATQQDVAFQNGQGILWGNMNQPPYDTTGMGGAGGGIGINTDKCVAQRPIWSARLKQCEQLKALLNNETASDSTTVNNIINSILDGMVSVCHNSLTPQQIYGASNVNPAYLGSPQNFEEVINQVFAANGIHTLPGNNYFCNPYTIDYPKPYGKNIPVFTNYSNTIDSCGCTRFAALKLEAGSDSATFTSMNHFLLVNYNDTLTLPLWTGLQQCNNAWRDTCTLVYTVANNNNVNRLSKTESASLCDVPVITGITYDYNQYGLVISYTPNNGYDTCSLLVFDENNNQINELSISCTGSSVFYPSKDPCQKYHFKIRSYVKICGNVYSKFFNYNGCCPVPVINRVRIQLPNPTNGTQNVIISYTIPAGGFNCKIKAFVAGNSNPVLVQPITCATGFTTLNLPACFKYRFIVESDYSAISVICGIRISDTARLDSCWKMTCTKLFTPIILPTVVIIPQFLNCGYVKPCITCGKLDSLTAAFRLLYPAYSAVPYLDSTATDAQGSENMLWTRYLNYKTGFSKNALDYMMAYKNCHNGPLPPTNTALCSFTKPLNDPGVFFPVDTVPCRTVQIQTQFIAYLLYQQQKDSLIAGFNSLYKAKCFEAKNKEEFYVRYQPKEYHYTLYYYDQAGNLVKTIPPAAVKPNYDAGYLASVAAARNASGDVASNNNELLATNYRYNSLNQVTAQKTPDAGISKFWYDRLGRLVVSQNAKQITTNDHSYTLYDDLGRITEVGQVTQSTPMTQTISQDEYGANGLRAWLANKPAEQITRTFYDKSYLDGNATLCPEYLCQKNLRNRVSYTALYTTGTPGSINEHTTATFYSYDIHGNVDTLLQDYGNSTGSPNAMNTTGNRFKKLVYEFDLISGKVNAVNYQPNQADAFYHKYLYDAENRLTDVETSNDKIVWERDARYNYYRHGPLARTVVGNNQVQGIDYAYTLQGQLKGINSTSVGDGIFDMGQDGKIGSSNSNIARDAYGISMNYFTGDYKPISNAVTPFASIGIANDLFNGNIKSMVVNIPKLGDPLIYGFKYDQLNRLVAMDAYNGLNNATNTFTAITINDYKERLTYDPNGNIKTYLRNGTGATINLNNYSYTYTAGTNKLASVTNSVNAQTKNYGYDPIGNTTTDGMQNMTNAVWNVYGKLQSATNKDGASVAYTYSASGQRISKKVGATEEWYVKDVAGNTMATYSKDPAVNSNHLSTTEFYKYGSRLLSIKNHVVDMEVLAANNGVSTFTRGEDGYILTDGNGNTRAIVTDKKIQVPNAANPAQVLYYLADVKTASYYSSFGANAKTFGQTPVYGFNGQMKSEEIGGDSYTALYWEYDARTGRRWNVDPLASKYPMWSPYMAFANNPIRFVDLDGREPTPAEAARMAAHVYGDKKNGILTGGWQVSSRNFGIKLQDATGLKSLVYERVVSGKVTEYTYATAGTEANWKDVGADVKQPLGLSKQYGSAADNAKKLSDVLGSTELTFTGHSLGGGEAALNALVTDRKAITFNAAGVSDITKFVEGTWKTPFKSESKIDAYIMSTDPLNNIQNNSILPDVNGKRHYLAPTDGSSIYNGHSMDNVLKNFGVKKPEEQKK